MCCSKRRAAAYRGYPPATETADPAFGPYYGRRECRQGRCGPGLIRKLVTKAIENRQKRIQARQELEESRQIPQRSIFVDVEKQPKLLQEGNANFKAQPVKIVFDEGHEEYLSTYAEDQAPSADIQPQRREDLPRYSEVMKT